MTNAPTKALLSKLLSPETAEYAAKALANNSHWLNNYPPKEVINALGDEQHSIDSNVMGLARAWNSAKLTAAILHALEHELSPNRRHRLAWVVKQNADANAIDQLLALARLNDEDPVVRRYLVEAVTGLAFAGKAEWSSCVSSVRALRADPDSGVREAAAALTGAGIDHDSERRVELIAFLYDEEPSVIATAATALQRFNIGEGELPAELVQRLREHSRPDVRMSVAAMLNSRR